MKKTLGQLKRALELFEAEDDPKEPAYDPVHLGAVLIVNMVVMGGLYWLLWTLLVYEGGIFLKLRAGLCVLLTSQTLQDYGYRGPYRMGAFEGWFGNAAALILSAAVVIALHRLYKAGARRAAKR